VQKSSVNFIGSLALYQHRRDSALGLNHVTTKQRGLLWYYNTLQDSIRREFIAAQVKRDSLLQIHNRLKRITREAKTAPIERKRELLAEAMKLEELAKLYA
jgi:hypothetical protein